MKILVIFIFFLFSINSVPALENKILLKVENEIITSIDVENEKNYLKALNPNINNLDKVQLHLISKNSLIREKIKENEILKYLKIIELDEDFLNKLIQQRYSRLNLNSKSEFLEYLKNYKIDIKTIEKKISIEALWNQIIYQKFFKNVKIDKAKLEEQISKKNKEEEKNLLLSEIVFKIKDKNNLTIKYNKILEAINKDSFEGAALTHSISDSSTIGGKLGWIKQNSLNETIKENLANLKKGEISKPIFTPNGYLIIKVDDIKFIKIKKNKMAQLDELIKYHTNQQLNQLSIIYFNKLKKDTNINEL